MPYQYGPVDSIATSMQPCFTSNSRLSFAPTVSFEKSAVARTPEWFLMQMSSLLFEMSIPAAISLMFTVLFHSPFFLSRCARSGDLFFLDHLTARQCHRTA